ncbi:MULTISPECIES: tyrosine-type recombinase/integrase [Lachnospiraceae]|jgi:SPBc2 prophage-derived recombinase-like protein yomM|uniref:tyrosine-type recombinase/integrase n=1 Tax=Coprococcus sp. AM11-30B TaxID=2997950 RepID=UPI000E4A8020|nr:site-specific integrase [Coprococcus sp. AM11-30B]RGI27661.1 hypothetical protein DXC15_10395 [Ruminococcus sp. OM08-13AT]RGI55175.1 hypothetical protein DXA86_09345 [Ruminococcus sp. OF05-2BH]DAN57600.1 MAG TPA: Integrase [Bacteriophage sp.]
MGRTTIYNKITNEESIKKINPNNKQLCEDFLEYLASIDRAPSTINGYRNDLEIFFCWNLEYNNNKFFVDIKKRELARFQGYAINEWGWSPKRIRRVKSAISSMSNYIENILQDEDEDFENFRSIIGKIESPKNEAVREKTIIPDDDVDKFLDKLVSEERYQQACAFALAAMSGARKSELLRFKVEYFDENNIVYGGLYKTPKIKTKGAGKTGKQLNKYVLYEFKKYLDLWMEQRKKQGIESEWLFVHRCGDGSYAQMKVSTLDSWANIFSNELGVDFYWHCMRHYLNTKLLKLNIPANVVQEFFGWSSSDMVNLYNDSEVSEEFSKYFTKDGIVEGKSSSLSDL